MKMKRIKGTGVALMVAALWLTACHKLEGEYNDARYNYDVLWRTLDERY